jgi:argininosuccinate synthase
MSRVGIVGSRKGVSRLAVRAFVFGELAEGDVVVSGGAPGVDTWAVEAAEQAGLDAMVHPADWKGRGKRAGYERNVRIVDDSDRIVAFWDGMSFGTKLTIDYAMKVGVPVEVRTSGASSENGGTE